jgi:hypothetical protein
MNKITRFILAAFVGIALAAPPANAAFSNSNLYRDSAGQNDGVQTWIYDEVGATLATIMGANYLAQDPQPLDVGDLITFRGSNGVSIGAVTAASTTASTVVEMTGTAAALPDCIESTVTFDPAPTTFGSVEEKDVTATGAALGDTCLVSAPYDLTNQVQAECYVDATDSVVINLRQPGIRLNGSATHNPTNVDDGDVDTDEITVTGAALGDPASCTFSLDLADLALTCSVTAANTVTATFLNNTGAAVDLDSGTITARVEDVSASAVNLASGTWNARTCTAPTP